MSLAAAIRIEVDPGAGDTLFATVGANGASITMELGQTEVFTGTLGPGDDFATLGALVQAINAAGSVPATAVMLPPYSEDDEPVFTETQTPASAEPGQWIYLEGDRAAEPIIEQIAQAIEAKLQTVRSALETPAQQIQVSRPSRTAKEAEFGHLSIVMTQQAESREESERPHPAEERVETFDLYLFVVPSEKANPQLDPLVNRFMADVWLALMEDPQWNELAIDSWIEPLQFFTVISGEYGGVVLPLAVQYRTQLDNPYVQ